MSHPLLATRLYNCALLITPGKAEIIERVFRAREEGRPALLSPPTDVPKVRAMMPGSVRADGGYERTKQGVAIIQMLGPLVQRGGMDFGSGGPTGYNEVSSELQAALDDPRIDAILLEIDSPGGEANGAFDLQAKIRAAAQKKPTWAIANEQAFSAAYLQASGAGKLFVPEPGMVGSIGVVMLHVDQSQKDSRAGMVYTPIFAGDRKVDFSSHAPLSEDAMAMAQAEVDRVYGLFVSAVADGRGIDAQVVRHTQAGLLAPAAALELGLIDGVQSFDETLAQLAAEGQHVRTHGMRGARVQQGADWQEVLAQRDSEQRARAELGLTHSPTGDTAMDQKELDAKLAAAKAEGEAAGKASAEADAAKKLAEAQTAAGAAAQARISAILTHAEAAGRATLAQHLAFKTTQSVDEAVAMLTAAPKQTAASNQFAAAMDAEGNPRLAPDAAGKDAGTVVAAPDAANVYAFRRECVAKARKAQ